MSKAWAKRLAWLLTVAAIVAAIRLYFTVDFVCCGAPPVRHQWWYWLTWILIIGLPTLSWMAYFRKQSLDKENK